MKKGERKKKREDEVPSLQIITKLILLLKIVDCSNQICFVYACKHRN